MRIKSIATLLAGVALAGAAGASDAPVGDAVAGEYVFHAAGCKACHTATGEGQPALAGGHVFDTPYGRFVSPNISSHPEHGLGRWTLAEFERAVRGGVAPDGSHYYPVFPYASYAGMSDVDVRNLFAYLRAAPAHARPNQPHELGWPFRWRWLNRLWKLAFFDPGQPRSVPGRSDAWHRGRYLATALGHCGECHTRRGLGGATDTGRPLAGSPTGPDDGRVPNLTPHPDAGISGWVKVDITAYLSWGLRPDGDFAGGSMAEVIEDGTGKLTAADRDAIAEYLLSLRPLPTPP